MNIIYLKLFGLTLIPAGVALALIVYMKYSSFGKIPKNIQYIIIGVIYGLIAIFGTEYGVNIDDKAMANVRDAAPLIAGIVFGGPCGIIAGLIGGIERYFAVYWGVGEYTRIACSVSTIISGIYSWYLRKYLFNNKLPLPIFAFVAGVIMETFHMSMVIFTHMNDLATSFSILRVLSTPMILANSFSLFITVFLIKHVFKKDANEYQTVRNISTRIQSYILIIVVFAFFATSIFTYILQTSDSVKDAEKLLQNNISKIELDLKGTSHKDDIFKVLDKINVSSKRDDTEGYVSIFNSNKKLLSGAVEHLGKTMDELGLYIDETTEKSYHLLTKKFNNEYYFLLYDKYMDYWIVTYVPYNEKFLSRDNNSLLNSYMEILVFALIFYIIYFVIKKTVVEKIDIINDGLNKITSGNLDTIIDVHETNEFSSLSQDINSTVSSLKHLMEEEKERIAKDMAFAKKIQSSSLPSYFPAFPKQNMFDIYATMRTAKEVGGDFYDFYYSDHHKITFLIADVSGKGVPAAMFMMTAKTMIKNFSTAHMDIVDIVNKANNELCNGNDAGMFVTAFIGVFDMDTGHIDYVNCGHNPPIIIRNKEAKYLESKKDFVLAGFEGYNYEKQSLDLNIGDRLYLYTDGVTEATNKKQELYGEPRLINLFNNNLKDKNIYDTLKEIQVDIDEFVDGAEQADDITMLEIVYNGGNS